MLSEHQVKRLLRQSESAYKSVQKESIKGWIQALRLVLKEDTYPIRNTPLKGEEMTKKVTKKVTKGER